MTRQTYLQFNLSLRDIDLASVTASNLLCLRDLVPYVLHHPSVSRSATLCRRCKSYLGAEVLKRKALNSVDAEQGAWLHNGEATGH